MKTKLLLLIATLLLLPLAANAVKVKIGDLYYNVVKKAKMASVTCCSVDECYGGDIVIPATVEYDGVVCNVTSIEDYAFTLAQSAEFYGNPRMGTNSRLKSVVIPESVTSIGVQAFGNCVSLKSVTIPGSVKEIGEGIFMGCSSLTSVDLGEGVMQFPDAMFSGCKSLTSIDIPESVTIIEQATFAGCESLTSINLPNVISIRQSAFSGCKNISSITFPNSLMWIDNYAFRNCTSLSTIVWSENLRKIGAQAFSGCTALTSAILPNSVVSIGSLAFEECRNLTTVSVGRDILELYGFYNCEELTDLYIYGTIPISSEQSFQGSMIEYATLHVPVGLIDYCKNTAPWNGFGFYEPISEEELGLDAEKCKRIINFEDPNVKELCVANWDFNGDKELSEAEAAFPTSFSNQLLGDYNWNGELDEDESYYNFKACFMNNTKIKTFDELKYFTGIRTLDRHAFSRCTNLTKMTLPENVKQISNEAFYGCDKLKTITLNDNLELIGNGAFSFCESLKSIVLPNSMKTIGEDAFSDSGLESITIPNSVNTIGEKAFMYCSNLISISLPNNLKSIESYTFYRCTSLSSIVIPNGVTSIGEYAFSDCTKLRSLTIPKSVTSIGLHAFTSWGGKELEEVKSMIKEPFDISSSGLFESWFESTLYVPFGTKAKYEATEGWNVCKNIIEMDPTLPGDVNEDGIVDVADITTVISVMAGTTADALSTSADVNGDGTVDVADIATIISIMAANARAAQPE